MNSAINNSDLRAQTPRELAECVWLRRYIIKTTGEGDTPTPSLTHTERLDTSHQKEAKSPQLPSEKHQSLKSINTSLDDGLTDHPSDTRPDQSEHLRMLSEVEITRAPNPTESLVFKRLLNRLSETIEEIIPQRIDLEATVHLTASSGGVTLFKPALECRKSTHLIWISDRSLHMSPWREVEDRILEMLLSQSSFATTLFLEVDLSDPAPLRLMDRAGKRVDLSDSQRQGRELMVALYTDGVSESVSDGRLGDALKGLPRGTRVIWLHPWGVRQLNRTPTLKLRGSRPLNVSDELIQHGYIPAVISELSDHGGFALSRWIHYHSPDALSARLIPTSDGKRRTMRSQRERANQRLKRSWSDRAKRFARSASPGAMELLALASAVPSLFSFSTDELYAIGYHFIEIDAKRPESSALRLYLAEALTSGFLMRTDGDRLKFVNAEAQHVIMSYVDYITLRHVLIYMIKQAEACSDTTEDKLKLKVLIALRDLDAKGLADLLNREQYAQVKEFALVLGVKLISTPKDDLRDVQDEPTQDDVKIWCDLQRSFKELVADIPTPLSKLSEQLGEAQDTPEAIERLISLIDAYLIFCAAIQAIETLEESELHTSKRDHPPSQDALTSNNILLSQFSEGIIHLSSWSILKAQLGAFNDDLSDGFNRVRINIQRLYTLIEGEDYRYYDFRDAWLKHLDAKDQTDISIEKDLKYTYSDLVRYGTLLLDMIKESFASQRLSLNPQAELIDILQEDKGTCPYEVRLMDSKSEKSFTLSPLLIYLTEDTLMGGEGFYAFAGIQEKSFLFKNIENQADIKFTSRENFKLALIEKIKCWIRDAARARNYMISTDYLFREMIKLDFDPNNISEPHLGNVLSMIINDDDDAPIKAKELIDRLSSPRNRKTYVKILEADYNQRIKKMPKLSEQEIEFISKQLISIYELLASYDYKVDR